MNHTMTWADFYLICFAVGFCLSFFSFVLGGARTGHLHLPHFHGHGHVPSASAPAAHSSIGSAHAPDADGANHSSGQASGASPFNFITLTAFLAWFGGTGYLLTRYSGIWVGFGLIAAIGSGLVGGGTVFVFLSKVLTSKDENMDPADYEMIGVLGRVCSSIREGGTGELIYAQMGTRRVCGARSDDGSAIAKGAEIVVTRYEKGIAYVRLWSEMSAEEESSSASLSNREEGKR
jgi:hypothetical protein